MKCPSHPSMKQGSENFFHETSDYCEAITGLINITGVWSLKYGVKSTLRLEANSLIWRIFQAGIF